MKLTTKSFDNTLSTGATAQSDFLKNGYINVSFYKGNQFVGIEIAGFCNGSFKYYLNPKNEKQLILNKLFIENFIDKCENAEEIKNKLFEL